MLAAMKRAQLSLFALLAPLTLATASACTAGTTGTGGAGGESTASSPTMSGGTTSGFSQSNGSTGTGFGTASTGSSMSDCSEESKLVYVFSSDNKIYSFDPPSKKFTLLGSPDCDTFQQPNSMAVDRNLVAWINYIGSVYTVDLASPGLSGCQHAMDLPSQFQQIGMGFATNSVGTTDETLFIDGIGGGGLAKIDTVTKQVTTIGDFSNDQNLQGQSAELTGTGDARLYGYFTTSPNVRVAEIDKSNANVLSDDQLQGVSPPSSWAFSFWGGELYLYAATLGNSRVVKFNPTTKALDASYISDVGFTIIGAGVSTCAPTIPPS